MPRIKTHLNLPCQCTGIIDEYYLNGGVGKHCPKCEFTEYNPKKSNEEFKMPFGKHAGTLISDMPSDYVLWAYRNFGNNKSLKKRFENEVKKRNL